MTREYAEGVNFFRITLLVICLALIGTRLGGQRPGTLPNSTYNQNQTNPAPGSGMTVQSDGKAVGTRGVLNILPGAGISTAITDTGSQINIQQAIDSAVVQTLANQQSGRAILCTSASASGRAYTCSMSPTLTTYTIGMIVNWKPDVNGAGGATTLNIDALSAKPIKLSDGTTNPGASDIVAGRLYPIWYDGTAFRKLF